MYERLKAIKIEWEDTLFALYGGELEINFIDGNYYACAFHTEPKGEYDSWIEKIKEFDCLGNDENIERECHKLGIPVCH